MFNTQRPRAFRALAVRLLLQMTHVMCLHVSWHVPCAQVPRPKSEIALPYKSYSLVNTDGVVVERIDKHPFCMSRVYYNKEERPPEVWAEDAEHTYRWRQTGGEIKLIALKVGCFLMGTLKQNWMACLAVLSTLNEPQRSLACALLMLEFAYIGYEIADHLSSHTNLVWNSSC